MDINKVLKKIDKILKEEKYKNDENALHIIKIYDNLKNINSERNLNLNISNISNIKNVDEWDGSEKKDAKNSFVYIIDLNDIKIVHSFFEVTKYRYEKILDNFKFSKISSVFKKYKYPYYICDLERCINKLKRIYKINTKKNKKVIVLYKNYNGTNKQKNILNILSKVVTLLEIKEREERNSRLYDMLCEYLENDIRLLNYCDFKNSICIAKRDKLNNNTNYPKYERDGCCHSFVSPERCEYLNNKNSCDIKCISCKAFVCKYLKERGQGYDFFDSVIFRCFCNPLKNRIFVWNFFKPKEYIIKKYNSIV